MSELLTTKQLQELLKIDRVTVYRMLNDGRLKGVKIGNQWRFPQSEIDRLMGEPGEPAEPESGDEELTDFPTDCVQHVQEIFAGIIGIGAITVTLRGEPLDRANLFQPILQIDVIQPQWAPGLPGFLAKNCPAHERRTTFPDLPRRVMLSAFNYQPR